MARHYTIQNQLDMLSSAYFDLFSVKGYKPNPKDLKNWLIRYRRRETFKNDLRTNKDKNQIK